MDAYFQEAVNPNLQQHDLMKYEWGRYRTFQTFPKTSRLMPLRLAQAGFFYTGHGESVKCFCCNVCIDTWAPEETAMQVHRRLSPRCSFILGHSTPNVSIHGDTNSYVGETRSRQESRRHLAHIDTSNSEARAGAMRPASKSAGNNSTFANISSQHERQTREFTREFNCQPSESASVVGLQHSSNTSANTRANGPKHPQYAIKIVRVSSFSGWPAHRIQTPEDLATAGFFYIGLQDCVRCFQCGGGLRNWEYGDSAWTEHARWYPGCAYVNRCKGDAFIARCRSEGPACGTEDPAFGTELPTGTLSPAGKEAQKTEEQPDRKGHNDPLVEEYRTRAVEMGYNQDLVETAVHQYSQLYGDTAIEFDLLLEVIENLDTSRSGPQSTDPTRPEYGMMSFNTMDREPSTGPEDTDREACSDETGMPNSVEPPASATRESIKHRQPRMTSTDIAHTSANGVTNITRELVAGTSADTNILTVDAAKVGGTSSKSGHTTCNSNSGSGTLSNVGVNEKTPNNTHETSRPQLNRKELQVKKHSKERQALEQENHRLREQMVCKVCLEADACILFLPCGHLVCCQACAPALRKCAVCRALVRGTVKIYTG